MQIRSLSVAAFTAIALSACGGGGGGTTAAPVIAPTTAPNSSTRSTATITLNIPTVAAPNTLGSSSARRGVKDLSPGTDKISFMVDGAPVITDAEVDNYTNAGPAGNGVFSFGTNESVTLGFAQTPGNQYFTVTLALLITPGTHKFGVVILGNNPADVISEGEQTYTLEPGNNTTVFSSTPLALSGIVSYGYVSCATDAQNASTSPSTCNNYANFAPARGNAYGGTYSFTAVAADLDGYPIPYQMVNGAALPFDNGGFSVEETDGGNIVSVNAPTSTSPGNALTGPITGNWATNYGASIQYGVPFTVTCLQPGTATLQLVLNAQGGTFTSAPAGSPDTAKYPQYAVANGVLPMGLTGGNPGATGRINNVTVNCTSTGSLTVI